MRRKYAKGPEDHGRVATYQVDIDFFGWDSRAILYRDGRQMAKSAFPARFPVPGGRIEVLTSTFGVRRMHMVSDDGTETQLTPHPRSGEGLRAALERKHPNVSTTIAVLAVIVLLGSLVLGMPQLVDAVSHWDLIADNIGTFTSPFTLPAWLNTTLLVASIIAAIERALTLRYHWLIDTDAGLLGG